MLGSNSVSFNGKTLSKIQTEGTSSKYRFRDATEQYDLTVRHSLNAKTGVDRHNIEVIHTVWATSEDAEIVRKVYHVIELKPLDQDTTLAAAMAAFVVADTNLVLDEMNDWKS